MSWEEQTKENYKRYQKEWMNAMGIKVTDNELDEMWRIHTVRFD